jgi:hypothetical protein
MKSYFLQSINSPSGAEEALNLLLPGQREPWLLKDTAGDTMAYINVEYFDEIGAFAVEVDISGRHYNCDAEVIALLEKLKAQVGGDIECQP